MPNPNAVVVAQEARVCVRLDQVQNFIHSMVLLSRSEALSGLGSWIYETYSALTPEERAAQRLVMIGLHYAVLPDRDWADVPSYLDHLAEIRPERLRDKVLETYLTYSSGKKGSELPVADQQSLLDDLDFFLEYLVERFGEVQVDESLEREAHVLLNDPEEMRAVISTHLRMMWEEYFQDEWKRVKPMLDQAVQVFNQKDYGRMSLEEAGEYITGQELKGEHWNLDQGDYGQIIFVPSAHIGPYLGKFKYKNALGVIFGARLPKDSQIEAPHLSRNEILVRLGALTDETRLRILKLVADEGEQFSQEIMDKLELSQSAASRHLKQLSATGHLTERRRSNAKCYELNAEHIRDTLSAVAAFLLDE